MELNWTSLQAWTGTSRWRVTELRADASTTRSRCGRRGAAPRWGSGSTGARAATSTTARTAGSRSWSSTTPTPASTPASSWRWGWGRRTTPGSTPGAWSVRHARSCVGTRWSAGPASLLLSTITILNTFSPAARTLSLSLQYSPSASSASGSLCGASHRPESHPDTIHTEQKPRRYSYSSCLSLEASLDYNERKWDMKWWDVCSTCRHERQWWYFLVNHLPSPLASYAKFPLY